MKPNYTTVLILTIGWIWIAIWLFRNAFVKKESSDLEKKIEEWDDNSYV